MQPHNQLTLNALEMHNRLQSGRPILSKQDSQDLISDLLSKYFLEQNWEVAWPKPIKTPLLHVASYVRDAYSFPEGPTNADLQAAKVGLLESIPLEHFLLNPQLEREMNAASFRLEEEERQLANSTLHAPYRNAKEKNLLLTEEDFQLINVDFASDSHNLSNLHSLFYLHRPIYTEMGRVSAVQRKANRLAQILSTDNKKINNNNNKSGMGIICQQGANNNPYDTNDGVDGEKLSPEKHWIEETNRTFRNAKQLDVEFNILALSIAKSKLGLIPGPKDNGGVSCIALAKGLMSLFAYLGANGVALGQRKDNDNGNKCLFSASHNRGALSSGDLMTTRHGAYACSIIWKEVCRLAQMRWKNEPLPAGFKSASWVAQVMERAGLVSSSQERDNARIIFKAEPSVINEVRILLESWISHYTKKLFSKTNVAEECPLEHTTADFTIVSLGEDSKNKTLHLVTNLDVPEVWQWLARFSRVEAAVEAPPTTAMPDLHLKPLRKPNGAIPLAIYPVLPAGFSGSGTEKKTEIDSSPLTSQPDFSEYLHYGNPSHYTSLRVVTLNGEKNTFNNIDLAGASAASHDEKGNSNFLSYKSGYKTVTQRVPQVLLEDPSTCQPAVYLRPNRMREIVIEEMKAHQTDNGEDVESNFCGATYTVTGENRFIKYLAQTGDATAYYVLRFVPQSSKEAGGASVVGSRVEYARIPSYGRCQSSARANVNPKCVMVSFEGTDEEAKKTQRGIAKDMKKEMDNEKIEGEVEMKKHRGEVIKEEQRDRDKR